MRRVGCAWVVLALATGATCAPAMVVQAQAPQVRVTLQPDMVKLGESVRYRVEVIGGLLQYLPGARAVEWLPPDTSAALTWGAARSGLSKGVLRHRPRFGESARSDRIDQGTPDTSWVEIPLQVFALGVVPIPGVEFRYWPAGDGASSPVTGRAPTARLVVLPTLSSQDTSATLHPVRGPLAAPWWERVPWRWVAAILAALALVVWLVRGLRRRPRTRPAAPALAALAPAETALAALAELRRLDLPGQQRFAEHSFQLGQILRHYLEALWPTARPGDTTPELVSHLGEAGLSSDDVRRLAALLRVWDRVKFAREPFTADEASRAESSVEAFVRRTARPVSREAA